MPPERSGPSVSLTLSAATYKRLWARARHWRIGHDPDGRWVSKVLTRLLDLNDSLLRASGQGETEVDIAKQLHTRLAAAVAEPGMGGPEPAVEALLDGTELPPGDPDRPATLRDLWLVTSMLVDLERRLDDSEENLGDQIRRGW